MVDCDTHPNNSACEKPVSDVLKTAVPVSIFGVIFITAGIVFWVIMHKRRQQERVAEEKARQKYRDLGFDEDEPQRRGKKGGAPAPANNRQSMGPGSETNYHANPNAYLRDNGSSFQLSQLHPSLDGQQKPTAQKEFV